MHGQSLCKCRLAECNHDNNKSLVQHTVRVLGLGTVRWHSSYPHFSTCSRILSGLIVFVYTVRIVHRYHCSHDYSLQIVCLCTLSYFSNFYARGTLWKIFRDEMVQTIRANCLLGGSDADEQKARWWFSLDVSPCFTIIFLVCKWTGHIIKRADCWVINESFATGFV